METWLGTVRLDLHSLYPNDPPHDPAYGSRFTVSMFGDNQASHAHSLEQPPSDCDVFYEERKKEQGIQGAVKAYRSYAHRSDCDSLV